MSDDLFPYPPRPGARASDPPTSWKSARINQRYRNQLRFNMLLTHGVLLRDHPDFYLASHGMTANETAKEMDLAVPANGGTSGMCYWKRISELYKEYGYLEIARNQWGGEIEREGQHALIINGRGLGHIDEVLGRFPDITDQLFD